METDFSGVQADELFHILYGKVRKYGVFSGICIRRDIDIIEDIIFDDIYMLREIWENADVFHAAKNAAIFRNEISPEESRYVREKRIKDFRESKIKRPRPQKRV